MERPIEGDVKGYFSPSAGRGRTSRTSSPPRGLPLRLERFFAAERQAGLLPFRRFHDTIRCSTPFDSRNLQAERVGNVPTMVLSETRGLWLSWVIRKGIGWELRLSAEAQAYFPTGYSLPNPSVQEPTGQHWA